METRPKVHVCSLSLSALKGVSRDLENTIHQLNGTKNLSKEDAQNLQYEVNRLRWCELSMEYNQHQQLQYIYQFNGDKAANPEFRNIKLRSVLKFWKRERLRQIWLQAQEKLLKKNMVERLNNKNDYYVRQRALLASKSFIKGLDFYTVPVEDLVPIDLLNVIDSFQCPASTSFGFENRDHAYCFSDAVKDFSSENETNDTIESNTFEANYREQFISRAVAPGGAVPFKTRNLDLDDESSDIFVLDYDNKPESVKNEPSIDSEPVVVPASEGKIEEKKKEEVNEVQPQEEKPKEELVKTQKPETPASSKSMFSNPVILIILVAALAIAGLFIFKFVLSSGDAELPTPSVNEGPLCPE